MKDSKPSTAYHATPDEAFWSKPEESPAVEKPESTKPATQYAGRFRKGYDPRRYKLTSEKARANFELVVFEILPTRYPNAIMKDGRHMACNFLRRKAACK